MDSRLAPAAGAAILLAAAAFASWVCFRQLGGYDLSPLVDAFWRLGAGEAPGKDFINTWPPLLLIIAKLVGKLRLGWFELTLANIVATLLSYAAVIALTERGKRSLVWCSAVAVIMALPLVHTNHIWHSSLSQLCAIVFFFSVYLALEKTAQRPRHDAALLLSAAALAGAKQNIALPALAATLVLVMVTGGERRWRLAALIGGGAALGVALSLVILGMSFESFTGIYTAVLGRARPNAEMFNALMQVESNPQTLAYGAAAIALLGWSMWSKPPVTPARILLFGGFAILSLLPILSDWDTKLNNISLPLFVVATHLVLHARADGQSNARRWRSQMMLFLVILAGLLATAVVGGVQRERMYHVGPGTFYEAPAQHVVTKGYFAGMHSGERLAATLDEMERVKASLPQARIFFGPRIEFGYAATATVSPQDLPLWWHPGTSYATSDEQRVVDAFQRNRFDVLVFLKNDRTRMPPALLDVIAQGYRLRPASGGLDIYDRRQPER